MSLQFSLDYRVEDLHEEILDYTQKNIKEKKRVNAHTP